MLTKLNENLLSIKNITTVTDLYNGIKQDFDNKTVFRTMTEMRVSVLNELHFPDPHAKYWQLVREQQVHFEQLVQLSFNYRKLEVKIKMLERNIREEKDELERELLQIKLERKQYSVIHAKKEAEERTKEIVNAHIRKSEQIATGSVETRGPDYNNAQLKSYAERFIREWFASGNSMPPADAQNVIGKAYTVIRECVRCEVWEEVKQRFPSANRNNLQNIYNSLEQKHAIGELGT